MRSHVGPAKKENMTYRLKYYKIFSKLNCVCTHTHTHTHTHTLVWAMTRLIHPGLCSLSYRRVI
jgi:hypothetical protein